MRLRRVRIIRQLRYFGWHAHCVVCRSHLRNFVPNRSDPEMRWDSTCPVCQSKGPHRRAFAFFWPRLLRSRLPRFLHVAPEPSLAARLSSLLRGRYVSGDLARGRGLVQFDVAALPFASRSFDFLYACHVLTQIPGSTLEAAATELFRVLKPGGVALIESGTIDGPTVELESANPEERVRRFYFPDVLRVFGTDDYHRLLERAGFRIETRRIAAGQARGGDSAGRPAQIETAIRPFRS